MRFAAQRHHLLNYYRNSNCNLKSIFSRAQLEGSRLLNLRRQLIMTSTDLNPNSTASSSSIDETDQQPLKKIKLNEDNQDCAEISLTTSIDIEEKAQDTMDLSETGSMSSNKILTESDVHITEFISSNPGFTAIIKHRFSDFLVNEVDISGQVVKLTNLQVPTPPKDDSAKEESITPEEGKAILAELIQDVPTLELIKHAIDTGELASPFTTPIIEDKSHRTKIHLTVKKYFPQIFNTETKANGILFMKPGNSGGARQFKQRERSDWKALGGDYLHFTLYKENKDSMEALDVLGKKLRCPPKTFAMAGTKDKRGITVQRVSAYRVNAQNLARMNNSLQGIRIGDYEYRPTQLRLGDLSGNRFSIVLRDIQPQNDESIHKAMLNLKDKGFINYFGMQRFGTHSIATHDIGIQILKGDWKNAVDLIVGSRDQDSPSVQEARKMWTENQDAKGAARKFPRRCVAERSVMIYFDKKGRHTDFFGAITSIPRNLRLLYVHAYQSLVWNAMATERIRLYGNNLVVGDLVAVASNGETSTESKEIEDGQEALASSRITEVKVLETEEDLKGYTMDDLVLPLPGISVSYPKNDVFKAYETFMGLNGFHPLEMERKQKEFSLPGSYRKVLGRASDLEWRLVRYEDSTISLCQTDLDKSLGKPVVNSVADAPLLALVLEFTLESSCYATMALREFLKMDTASRHHANLSKNLKNEQLEEEVSV